MKELKGDINGLDEEKVSKKWATQRIRNYFNDQFSELNSQLTERISSLQSSMEDFKVLKNSLYSR